MSAIDTADAIRAIDAMTVDTCVPGCWCQLSFPTTNTKERFRWTPEQPILRFLPEEAA